MNEWAEKCVDGSEVRSVMMLLISSGLVSHITPYKADEVPVLLCGKIEHNLYKMFSCLQWTDLSSSSVSMYFGTLCVKDPNYAQVWCEPTQKCVKTFSILGLCWRTKINEIHKCNNAMSEANKDVPCLERRSTDFNHQLYNNSRTHGIQSMDTVDSCEMCLLFCNILLHFSVTAVCWRAVSPTRGKI